MPSTDRIRLDIALVERGLAASRQRARSRIMEAKVLVNGRPVDKPGFQVSTGDIVTLKGEDIPYVSRGGIKLEGALKEMGLHVEGMTCLDVGASTGGFTDCLLQHGAARVFAVDVGYGQIAWKLRQDPRVKILERTNIRILSSDALPCAMDLITIDVSFISLRIVVPAVVKFLRQTGRIVALIKPQFEVGKGKVGKGGVVRDPVQQEEVVEGLRFFFRSMGLVDESLVPSPILGPKGNREFFILLNKSEIRISKSETNSEIKMPQ